MTDLERLIAALSEGAQEHAQPPFAPGADSEAWRAAVAAARAEHDASAIRHRDRVDAACARLFGTTAAELLGARDLASREIELPVPEATRLNGVLLPGYLEAGVPRRDRVNVTVLFPENPSATIVRLHGGAFWMGGGAVRSIDRPLVAHLAAAANATVLDVDYRLAPEYPYPAALLDVLGVLDAVHAGQIPEAMGPIGLVGTSSGGNLATMVARVADSIAALGLIVPSVELAAGAQSADADPAAWESRRALLRGYMGELDPADPWFSPGALDRLDGMPPTFAVVAERDEVAAGAAGLCAAIRAAGQDAQTQTYPMTHVVAPPQVEAAFIRDLGTFLARELTPPSPA